MFIRGPFWFFWALRRGGHLKSSSYFSDFIVTIENRKKITFSKLPKFDLNKGGWYLKQGGICSDYNGLYIYIYDFSGYNSPPKL